jgi:branched-chain amino acid transport system ATP-binding protein
MNTILTVDSLYVAYGHFQIIKDLSFEVYKGEVLGIIGPNGAGKTTLLNALIGMVKPVQGKIIYKGEDITQMPVAKRCHMGIGRTYQVPQPFVNLTVYENVLVSAIHGAGLLEKEARKKSYEVLEFTGLLDVKDAMAGKLGLLSRKRLEIAKAYATNPEILLLDEVAAGLTESEVNEVMEIVADMKKSGLTIIWIEHIIMTMLNSTDRLMCLSGGTNLVCGPAEEVMATKEVEEVYLGVEED